MGIHVAAKGLSVADLHCDLLWYLSLGRNRTPFDPEVRCSVPQLRQGNVVIQTLPIFAETFSNSVESGLQQVEIYKQLPKKYPKGFEHLHRFEQLEGEGEEKPILILPAVENASAICGEEEELERGLERFTQVQRRIGKLLYVSLTWNSVNRFGGGALTREGLKEDGKRLIDYLHVKGIGIDFSHASDHLAYDMLDYFEKEGIAPIVLASHSNMRKVANYPRNLPDDLAKEIIRRDGVIGLNFIRYLVGRESADRICNQLAHLIALGGSRHVSIGADFFCPEDMNPANYKPVGELFFESVSDSGCYGKVIDLWKRHLGLNESILKGVCKDNFLRFAKMSPLTLSLE